MVLVFGLEVKKTQTAHIGCNGAQKQNKTKPKALDDFESFRDLWHLIPSLSPPQTVLGFSIRKID